MTFREDFKKCWQEKNFSSVKDLAETANVPQELIEALETMPDNFSITYIDSKGKFTISQLYRITDLLGSIL